MGGACRPWPLTVEMQIKSLKLRSLTLLIAHCAVAIVLVLCFRALVFTVCTVEGDGLRPLLTSGDRVLVNRWSYGLRVGGGEGLFSYGRIGRRPVRRGDVVAFDNPLRPGEVLLCRCQGLPGDTISGPGGELTVVPGLKTCADADHYWMVALGDGNPLDSRTLGFIAERHIIGRAVMIIYSHDTTQPLWRGWRPQRFFLPL